MIDKGIGESGTAISQLIDVGGLNCRVAEAPQAIGPLLVGHDN